MIEVPIQKAWKKKYPEQIVFVVSTDQKGRPNIMIAGWFVTLSSDPPLVGVALANKRYTKKLISERREFVIAFPSDQMAQEAVFCGTHSGRDVDKFEATGLKTLPGKKTQIPLIKECVANFECKLVNEFTVGDHVLMVGEILAAYVSKDPKPRLYNFGNHNFKGISPEY